MSNIFNKITLNNATHSTIITPSATTNITLTLPTGTDTLSCLTTTDILTNKTLKTPIVGGSITTGAWGTNGVQSQFTANTYTDNTSAAGTVTNNMINVFGQPTIASTNAVTYTNAATVYIAGTVIAGTNTTITNPSVLQVNNTSGGLNNFSIQFTGNGSGNTIDFTQLSTASPYFDSFLNFIFSNSVGASGNNWNVSDVNSLSCFKVFVDGTKLVKTANNTLDDGSGNLTAVNITSGGQFTLTGTTYPNVLLPTNNKIVIGETSTISDTSNTIYQIGSGSSSLNMILVISKTNSGGSYIMHDGTNTWFANEHSGSFNFMSSGTYASTNLATSISGSTQWASISSSGVTTPTLILTNSGHTNTMSSTTLTGNSTFNLPPTTGINTQLLQTDGSGNTSWVTIPKITQTSFTSGTGTFTVPSGALNCFVSFWAGGGGGGGATGGGGGGGGGYIINVPLQANNTYAYVIAAPGSGAIFSPFTVASGVGGNTSLIGNYITYSTGTIGTPGQSSTTINGSGTTFTAKMVGGIIIATSTISNALITGFTNGTTLTVSPAVTIPSSSSYIIYYGGASVLATGGSGGNNGNGGSGGSGGTAPPTTYGGFAHTGTAGAVGNAVSNNGGNSGFFYVGGVGGGTGSGGGGGGGGAGFNGGGGNGGTNGDGSNATSGTGAGGGGAGNSGSNQNAGGNGGSGGMIFTYWV